MKTSLDYLNDVKAAYRLDSDYALAPILGITKQEVSKLRNRKAYMGDSTALKVARLLEINPAETMASAHAERAKNPEEKAVWASIVQVLKKSERLAACIAVGLAVFVTSPADSLASVADRPDLKIM